MKKIGFLGMGNMGCALSKAFSSLDDIELYGFDTDTKRLGEAPVHACKSLEECVSICETLLIAVKPNVVESLLKKIHAAGKLIVSIAAGVSIDKIKSSLQSENHIVRVMPNTPALVGEAMSVFCPDDECSDEDTALVRRLLETAGKTLQLPESYINAVTALSGSGPAYVFTFIQAMADAGVKLGLSRQDSLLLAVQTVKGSAQLVMSGNADPISLRNMVTSPGGTTIDAVHVLEKEGFSGIIMDAVKSAYDKACLLG